MKCHSTALLTMHERVCAAPGSDSTELRQDVHCQLDTPDCMQLTPYAGWHVAQHAIARCRE